MTNHAQKALSLFEQGHNCAQAVFTAFCDITNLDESTALKISSSFGGGIGGMKEMCGAITGMAMALGLLAGYTNKGNTVEKKEHTALVNEKIHAFTGRFHSFQCRDLLDAINTGDNDIEKRMQGINATRPCSVFVHDAAEMVDEWLKQQ